MDKLKPCPFCGSEVVVEKYQLWHGSHGYYGCYEFDIRCKKCGCHIRLEKNNTIYWDEETAKENAIEAWNRRASDEPEMLHNMSSC